MLFETLRHQRIIAAIDHHLKTFAYQDFGGAQGLQHVGIKSFPVAQDFEFNQRPAACFARKPQGAQRLFGGEATGGVRQEDIFCRIDEIDQTRGARFHQIHAAQRDGDDLGAGRFQSRGIFRVAFVLPGADDQSRTKAAPGDNERPVLDRRGRNRGIIAAADEMDDFQPVAIGQIDGAISRPGHDREIAFHRNLAGIQGQNAKQVFQPSEDLEIPAILR